MGSPRPTRVAAAAGWTVLVAVGLAACAGGGSGTGGAKAGDVVVLRDTLSSWYRDTYRHYHVAASGERAVTHDWRSGRGTELVDLRSGASLAKDLGAGLDEVDEALFAGGGRLVRRGRVGVDSAWFATGASGPRRTAVPWDARPVAGTDSGRVIWFRPSDSTLHVTEGTGDVQLAVGGPVWAAVRSPADGALFAMLGTEKGGAVAVRVRAPAFGDGSPARARASAGGSGSSAPLSIDTIAGPLDGTPEFEILAVGPRGRRLYVALASDSAPNLEVRHRPEEGRNLDLYEISVADGSLRRLTSDPGDDFAPQVAAGKLYWTRNDFHKSIVVFRWPAAADTSPGHEGRLVVSRGMIPYWRPDGREIDYTKGAESLADGPFSMDVWGVEVDSGARPMGAPRPRVQGYHEDFTTAWSPDGAWIAYHSHRPQAPVWHYAGPGIADDVFLRRPDAPMSKEIRLTDFGWEVGFVDWSPDGRRIVFTSWEKGGEPGRAWPWIATVDTAAGKLASARRLDLPPGAQSAESGAWAPDGDELAFDIAMERGGHALWVRDLGPGGGWRKVVDFPSSTYGGVDWTPDGRELVYGALAGDRMQLFAVPASGGAPRQLTGGRSNHLHPQVSPDGRWIACTRLDQVKLLEERPLEGS